MRGDEHEKFMTRGMGDRSRGRGRPRTRWMDEVREMTGLSLYKLREETREREMWRSRIIAVTRGSSTTGRNKVAK